MHEPYLSTSRGLRWEFAPEWRDAGEPRALFGPDGLRLEEWLASGAARVVKHAPHRTVYRVVLPGHDFHVKHYRGDRREWLRSLFRASKARAEYAITRETARRGVPTLQALAFGETISWRVLPESYLITRTLPDAIPLVDYLEEVLPALPEPRRAQTRHALAQALGRFLAHKHCAGVRHDDLHPGNLLIRAIGASEIELHLIDLHAVHLGRPMSWSASRENLVILNRWFFLRCHRSDRRRAWSTYCAERGDAGLQERPRARALETATNASLVAFAQALDRRCLGGNRHYRAVRAEGARGYAVADLEDATLAPLLGDADALIEQAADRTLKKSASSAVIELDLLLGGSLRRVICKRFDMTAWSDPPAGLFRATPALRSWILGHGLRFRGLPTPRPLAMWQRMRLGMPGAGYLLLEKVPEALDLRQTFLALEGLTPGQRRARLRHLIAETAAVVRHMHDRNVSHRDLKAMNLLVSPADWTLGYRGLRETGTFAPPGKERVWLVDLVGVRRHGKLGRTRRVQNLARLNTSFALLSGLSRSDRLRFLRDYLGWGLYGRQGWKDWWKEIDLRTQAKLARQRRRGRFPG
jgi:tRNA A-37 threonylcarbamoyl transferase component Bud32